MARIVVLGGAGEMGSVAVADLLARTGHDVAIADLRADAAAALLRRLGASAQVIVVDVADARSLAEAVASADVVLNATYMRHNVAVTEAAIAAGVHLVDLGSYYPETLEQLALAPAAERAGCRIVPGCGVAPGLTNVLARLGADRLDSVDAIRLYSYITHPLFTSPGIVITRFDASTGISLVYEDGRLVERASFDEEELVEFPQPYGPQSVHLVPHPEPVTLPRSIDVRNVVFKVGYPEEENRRIRVLLELGFDRDEAFRFEGCAISPRQFAAAYIGSRGVEPGFRSANVKRVIVDGARAGSGLSLIYDFAVEQEGRSASSVATGTVAAIAADLVSRGGPVGVHPPESAFDPAAFVQALAARRLAIREQELPR